MSASEAETGRRQGPPRDSRDGDAALMARIRARDVAAFEELYRSYRIRLARFVLRLVRRPHLVEEVMDDTLVVVWNRAETFNGQSKLSTWIFAIAFRTAMKALRNQDDPVEDTAATERVSLDPTPEDEFGRQRIHGLLLEAISQLSPDQRAVVEFTYFHEMGYREIAQIMACPVDTVKTRMFHARRQLKRRLSGELSDWL